MTFVYLWNSALVRHRSSMFSLLCCLVLSLLASKAESWLASKGYACHPEVCDCLMLTEVFFFCNFSAQMHALALKDKEEEHAGLLHTAGEIQVC